MGSGSRLSLRTRNLSEGISLLVPCSRLSLIAIRLSGSAYSLAWRGTLGEKVHCHCVGST